MVYLHSRSPGQDKRNRNFQEFGPCVIGVVAWAGFLEGYLLGQTTRAERALLGLAAACLMLPIDHAFTYFTPYEGEYHYQFYAIGLVLLCVTTMMQRSRNGAGARVRRA